ncbi:MAG: pyridoxal phosphate-dependent aminotransferase [Treponema sp.]|nr:pyridoxal phosphate-dependent aminotransferase [Treponema sp.]
MIAKHVKQILESPSNGVIRKMFEEGALLKQKYGEDNVFDFSIGNPDLDPPKEVQVAIEKYAKDTSKGTHGYMPNAGYQFCRQAMADKTAKEQGVPVDFSNVVMCVGAGSALNVALKSLLNAGDEVIVPCPYFTEYDHYIHNHNGEIVRVPTKADFSLDIEAIKAALNEKTAAIIINSPNNPSGRIFSEEDMTALAAALKAFGEKSGRYPYIIADEPYRAITYGGKTVASVFPKYEYTIICTSFAKNLSVPGERIGYTCVNPACPEAKEVVAANIFCLRTMGFVNAPAFFQKVIAESWDAECDYSLYEKRRNELIEVMDYAGFEYAVPEGAFYLFVKVPEGWDGDDMAFTNHLKKFNILCAPGSGFGGKGWFRIAYCCAEKTILNSREAFKKAHDTPRD